MRQYKIFKNSYNIGQSKGMNKAVNHVKNELVFDGVAHLAKWSTLNGIVKCNVKDDEYVIEKDSGKV